MFNVFGHNFCVTMCVLHVVCFFEKHEEIWAFESFWGAFSFFSLHFYTWVASNNLFQHFFLKNYYFLLFGFREEEAQEESWRVFDLWFGLLQHSTCGMSKDVGVVNLISTSCNLSMKEGSLFVWFVLFCLYLWDPPN